MPITFVKYVKLANIVLSLQVHLIAVIDDDFSQRCCTCLVDWEASTIYRMGISIVMSKGEFVRLDRLLSDMGSYVFRVVKNQLHWCFDCPLVQLSSWRVNSGGLPIQLLCCFPFCQLKN